MSFIAEFLRKSQGSISKVKCFCWPKSIFHHYYIQNVTDRFSTSSVQDQQRNGNPF